MRYLIITQVKKERSSRSEYAFLWYYTLADGRISIIKEETFSYLVYNIVSLGKMAGKAEPFSWR